MILDNSESNSVVTLSPGSQSFLQLHTCTPCSTNFRNPYLVIKQSKDTYSFGRTAASNFANKMLTVGCSTGYCNTCIARSLTFMSHIFRELWFYTNLQKIM